VVEVKFDSDEWYPVYTFYPKAYAPRVVRMTNAEFVQFIMVQARWERWQAELAWRTGYYTAN
jgi:hypothetical protein